MWLRLQSKIRFSWRPSGAYFQVFCAPHRGNQPIRHHLPDTIVSGPVATRQTHPTPLGESPGPGRRGDAAGIKAFVDTLLPNEAVRAIVHLDTEHRHHDAAPTNRRIV